MGSSKRKRPTVGNTPSGAGTIPSDRQAGLGGGRRDSPEELEREIASTDAEIDNLVYELYGITNEERKIIEGGRVADPPLQPGQVPSCVSRQVRDGVDAEGL